MKYIWISNDLNFTKSLCELNKNHMTSTQEVPMYHTWIWFLASLLCTSYEWASRSVVALQWRHNGHESVSNNQPRDCLLNHLFRRRSKKHQSSASLSFVRGIHRGPVNSPHKWPVTRKMFPFDDVIMCEFNVWHVFHICQCQKCRLQCLVMLDRVIKSPIVTEGLD